MSLKNNQINAINRVLKNDFTSGVIQHATNEKNPVWIILDHTVIMNAKGQIWAFKWRLIQ